MARPRSELWPVAAAAVALAAALVRWWLQGSTNLYTAVDKRFYVPDVDLAWRVSPAHPVWLGLDACAVLLAIGVALATAGWLIRRRESRRGVRSTAPRALTWLLAAAALAVPIAAFASGSRPSGARDALPLEAATSFVADQITGGLDAPAGRYEVVAHDGTAITARLSAGGETFDARFAEIAGFWDGDPRALDEPIHAEIDVAAASVDTGVRDRSRHARTGYLKADAHPRIEVRLDRVIAARPVGSDEVAFRARGTLALIGREHRIEITGTVKRPDDAARARLGLAGSILLVRAAFSIAIADTALADKAGDFTGDTIPISVSLVLKKR